ncbi:MAG: FMN-binding protein [Rhodoglobus sp.]
MRTRATLGGIFASVAVLIVGWQAGAPVLTPAVTTSQPQSSGAAAPQTTTTTPSPTTTEAPVASGSTDGTFTGSSVSTRFGNVQVAVTISGGSITDVIPLQLTDADGKSVQISNRAAPVLHDEVLASQSAQVSNVGGATYTSNAYLASLQSALDQAGI